MKLHEILTETLEKPYQYKMDSHVEWQDKVGGKVVKGMSAKFTTDAGEEYRVVGQRIGFTKEEREQQAEVKRKREEEKERYEKAREKDPEARKKRFTLPPFMKYGIKGGIWEIHFFSKTKGEEGSTITGAGDAFRVLATVFKVIKEMVERGKPKIVSIKSKFDEPSRAKLYKRMADRHAKKLGYKVTGSKKVGDTYRIELRMANSE